MISTQDRSNLDGLIAYCIIYAQEMDYKLYDYMSEDETQYIVSAEYIDDLLMKLFLERLSQENTNYKINGEYIFVNKEDCQRITDTTILKLDELYYNEQYDIYKVVLNGVFQSKVISNIEIVYIENDDGYTVLKYTEV